jgi:HAD superfamily hydrolase (TIGR01509 family)
MQDPKLQAVIFDMDGVLADSEPHWDEIDADLLREQGVEYNGEHKAQVLGKSFPLALEFYRREYSLTPTAAELAPRRAAIAAAYYATSIPIFPAAPEVLQSLRDAKLRIGLATSSVGALARPFLERHGLSAYFDIVVSGEEVERGKPYPDIYLRAAQELGVAPQHCLVIEDALSGAQAARDAGMRVAAIPDARYMNVEDYRDKADYILESLSEVPALVKSLLV